MAEAVVRLFAPNLITICIDEYKDGDFSGECWNQYDDEPFRFQTMTALMFQMEEMYDRWNFPQRSTNCRTFYEQEQAEERTPNPKRGKKMNLQNVQDKHGKQGTFIVQVQYRQNSSWQGQVIWAEENKRVHFRSALELMKLIDSAMAGEAVQEKRETSVS